jgi:YD repeat-containing protein
MKIAKVAAIAVFALIASDAYAQIEDVHALDFAARSYQYGAVIRSKDQEPVIPVELLKEWGQYCAELSAGLQSDSQSRKSGLPRAICRSVSRYLSDSVLKTVTGRPNDDLGSLTDRQRVVIYGLATLKENLVAAFDTLVESRDVLNVAAESDRSFLRYNYSRAIAYRRDRAFDSFCAELRIRYKTAEHLADFLANNDQVSASKALTEWQDVFRDEEFRFFKWRMEKSGILLDKLLSDIRYFGPGGIASKIRAPCQRTTFSIESEPGSVARKLVVWIDERQRVYGELEFMPTRPRSLSLGATTKSFAYSTYGTVRDDRAILRFKLSASRDSGNPKITSTMVYDILDQLISSTQEVQSGSGETRSILGSILYHGPQRRQQHPHQRNLLRQTRPRRPPAHAPERQQRRYQQRQLQHHRRARTALQINLRRHRQPIQHSQRPAPRHSRQHHHNQPHRHPQHQLRRQQKRRLHDRRRRQRQRRSRHQHRPLRRLRPRPAPDRRLRQLLSLRLRRSQPGHPQSILGPRRRKPPRKLNKQQAPQPIPRQTRRARPRLRKLRRPLRHPNGTILDTYTSKPRFDRRSLTILARNPRGYTSSVVYDGLGRSVLSTDAKSNTVETIYDNNSNVLQTKRTEVETSTQTYYSDFQYDAADRQILSVDTLGNTHRSFYDSTSQLVASTDANSSGTASIATQSRGGSFSITGNSDGNRIFYLTDRLGRSLATIRELRVNHDGANSVDTSNSYNSDGLITTSTFYDDNSRVTSRTDTPSHSA